METSVTLTQPNQLSATISNTPATSECLDPDGSASVVVSGGTAPYSYEWQDINEQIVSTEASVRGLVGGTYDVVVEDANGCILEGSTTVNTTTLAPIANAGADFINCGLDPLNLNGSIGGGSANVIWTTTGDGVFSDPTVLSPIYTPGVIDTTVGLVTLTLTTEETSICPSTSDNLTLTFTDPALCDDICVDTLMLSAAFLANDPHKQSFSASEVIISNGVITLANRENLIFDAPEVYLDPGFEVESGAILSVFNEGCVPLSSIAPEQRNQILKLLQNNKPRKD